MTSRVRYYTAVITASILITLGAAIWMMGYLKTETQSDHFLRQVASELLVLYSQRPDLLLGEGNKPATHYRQELVEKRKLITGRSLTDLVIMLNNGVGGPIDKDGALKVALDAIDSGNWRPIMVLRDSIQHGIKQFSPQQLAKIKSAMEAGDQGAYFVWSKILLSLPDSNRPVDAVRDYIKRSLSINNGPTYLLALRERENGRFDLDDGHEKQLLDLLSVALHPSPTGKKIPHKSNRSIHAKSVASILLDAAILGDKNASLAIPRLMWLFGNNSEEAIRFQLDSSKWGYGLGYFESAFYAASSELAGANPHRSIQWLHWGQIYNDWRCDYALTLSVETSDLHQAIDRLRKLSFADYATKQLASKYKKSNSPPAPQNIELPIFLEESVIPDNVRKVSHIFEEVAKGRVTR